MKKEFVIVAVLVFMMSFAVADISLSEPYDVYNLGDRLYVSTDGLLGSEIGNLNINLVCGNGTTNLVKISSRAFSAGEEQSYSIPYKILEKNDLEITDLNAIVGSCQIVASMGQQVASTKTFTISKDVTITATVDKAEYEPGEAVTVTIDAVKANGVALNGFIDGNANSSSFSAAVEEGVAVGSFITPETAEGGSYSLNLIAYDSGSNGILNSGETTIFFKVMQIPSSMIVSLSEIEVMPGAELTVGAEVFDQSGKVIDGTVPITIRSPAGEEIEVAVNTGSFSSTNFSTNATPGVWDVIAVFDELVEVRDFTVAELQKVEYDFEDSVLAIRNVGNTLYNQTIEIMIGDSPMELDLNINVGEVRKFNLKAPEGEYDVSVGSGDEAVSRSVLLTGNAISIKDLEEVGIFKSYSILWILLIVILAVAGVVFFIKYKKTRNVQGPGKITQTIEKVKSKIAGKMPGPMKEGVSNSLHFTNKSATAQSLDQGSYSAEDKSMIDFTDRKMSGAESTLVLKGEKSNSSVVAISIKNHAVLKDHAKNELIKAVNAAKNMKGLVDWRDDYVFVVFSPLVTRTYKNEALAVKAGSIILGALQTHNKKFRDKIDFNIGVHSGELIASKEGKKLKYTSIGNTVSFAKRMSDVDNGKLLVSEEIRKKLLRDLKVTKDKEIGERQVYSVSEIKNHEADKAKLKDLLRRMD